MFKYGLFGHFCYYFLLFCPQVTYVDFRGPWSTTWAYFVGGLLSYTNVIYKHSNVKERNIF